MQYHIQKNFFSYLIFFDTHTDDSRDATLKEEPSVFFSTTSTHSRTFKNLFAAL